MKRFNLILPTLIVFLAVASLSAPAAYGKDNWLAIRSKNFLLVGNASEKQIRQVATRLEQFREVFAQLFPKAVHSTPVPTTVIVFKSDESYRPFKPNPNVAGYFQPGRDVNYITLTTELHGEQDPFNVIFHGYTHLLINNTTPNVPLWFNEGLAEYYSTFSISEDTKVVLGSPISNHVFLLRENKMLPLRTLFQVDEKSAYYNERDKQSIFYAESWALIHYLVLGKEGQRLTQMSHFLNLMSTGTPMEAAFQQAFAMTFEAMEKELREYIKHDRYPVMTGHFTDKVVVETELQSVPLSEAEVQAYLGDLLFHSNRVDSEGYLLKALKLDPTLPMANASLAMYRLRQGKIDEARQMLERAAANSSDYLIHYYYAYALSRGAGGEDQVTYEFPAEVAAKMRTELTRAIELRPDFVESYSLLAFVNLVTNTNIVETVQMLKRALASAPGKTDLAFMLAQIYMRQENYKDARQLLEQLSSPDSDAREREQARALLGELKSMEEQLELVRKSRTGASATLDPPVLKRREESAAVVDPSSYLREALRKPEAGELQVQGTIETIGCDAKGIVFVIKVADHVLKLFAANFDSADITSFSSEAGSQISCGERKTKDSVIVCYTPASGSHSKVDGTLRSIEFVPKDFQLKPIS